MEAGTSTTLFAKSISVLDTVNWIAEAAKQVSHKWYRDVFRK
jgi:hypothetical protein